MDSPSVDSAGSPVSSIDASERQSANTGKHAHRDESAMQIDENTPLPASSAELQRKRKNEVAADDNNVDKKDKKAVSPKLLQSSRHASSDDDSDDPAVVVTSKQVKRPKLAEGSSTPARSVSAATSKTTAIPSSSAVKDANESAVVHFKNGKLLLKQKKIDFSQQNAALQKRIEWNGFIEETEEALSEIPSEYNALIALMIHESDKSSNELAKSVKNALNPPLSGDEDSQGDDNIDKLPLLVVSKTINSIAERINHGFRDDPVASSKGNVVTIEDSDDNEAGSSSGAKGNKHLPEERDLPKGYEIVPNGLRLFRWEVKPELRQKLFECLPKEMREKIEARAEERLTARAEAKKLLTAMSQAERKEILLKGVKTDEAASSTSKAKTKDKSKAEDKPTKKAKSSTASDKAVSETKKVEIEDDEAGDASSTDKGKGKAGRKPKELTEEEKVKKEEERLEKEKKKAEREAAKAVKDAAKAEKDAAKAEKEAAKAEKEAAKAKIEQAKKQQKNLFGAWLAKAGTSPVEAVNKPTSTSSHARQASSSSSSERGSLPPTAGFEPKKEARTSKDYYSTFKPFFVRAGVEVAPVNRFTVKKNNVKTEDEQETMDLDHNDELTKEESLRDFMSLAALERIPSSSKLQIQPISSVMTAMQECEIRGDMDSYHKLRAQLRNTDKYPFKLLKFHADVRPGYFGTWTKTSSTISGRNPYGRDTTLLDYDYDSEAEWDEDPEDAEDIKEDSGDEEMSESDDDLDGWLAGDDEVEFEAGYEGEMSLADMMDNSNDPFAQPGQAKPEDGKKKARKSGKPSIRKKKITGPLIPVIKGPYWQDEDDDEEDTSGLSRFMTSFKISWLGKNDCGTLDPFAHVEKKAKNAYNSSIKVATSTLNADGTPKGDKATSTTGPMLVKKPELPIQLLATFKQIVLSSTSTTKPRLLEELHAGLQGGQYKVNKSMIERTYNSLVDKKKKATIEAASEGSASCVWEIRTTQEISQA